MSERIESSAVSATHIASSRRSARVPRVAKRLVSGVILFAWYTQSFACTSSSSNGSSSTGASSAQPAGSASVAAAVLGGDAGGADNAGTAGAAGSASAASTGGTFTGSYASEQAQDPPPKKAEDDGGDGVGNGTLTLTIAPDNSAKGTLSGPLGDCILYGTVVGDTVTGTVFPKTSSSGSFYGTFVATRKDGTWSGKIIVSRGNAGAVRDASFTLKAS